MLIGACTALCLVVLFGYAGAGWASALFRLLTDGVLLLVWLACAAGWGGMLLRLLPLNEPSLSEGNHRFDLLHGVTAIALGLGVFSLAALGLGLAGWLNGLTTYSLLGIGALLGVAVLARSSVWRDRASTGDSVQAWLRIPAGWAWLWLIPMPFLGLAIVAALLPPGVMWPGEPHPYDVVEYHLQIPREWYELGRIVPLHHNAFSFFPFNVEMHYLLAMYLRGGPWAGMYLAHFMHLAMVALTVAAVYGFARRTANHPAGAHVAGVALATVPWLTQLGTIAYNEGGLILFGTLAMGWAFRAALIPARRLGRFPVAGLCAGFACGCKLTGVPEVLVAVGGLSLLAVILTRRSSDVPLTLRIAGVATFGLAGLLAFAPWLVRNQVWAGNPVFPEAAGVLGQGHFSDAQVERWRQAHSPRPDQQGAAARLKTWWTDVWRNPQYGYALLPAGLAAGVLALAARGRRESHEHSHVLKNARMSAFLIIAMFVALSVIWLGFTHLQGRFFILGAPIAALLVAHLPWGSLAARASAAVIMAVVAAGGFAVVHGPLAQRLYGQPVAMTALLGFEELSEMSTPEALSRVPADAPLALVGDARAFVYPARPGGSVFYRTVFDVDARPGESVIDAWSRGAPARAWLLVDASELGRFNRTYRSIPPLPPGDAERNEPFVIAPQQP